MQEIMTSNTATIRSIDLLDIINAAREEFKEPKVENRHLLARIQDELYGELGDRKTFTHPQNHKQIGYYDLSPEQCMLVGMRESKAVRRNVLAKLKELESKQAAPALPNFNDPVAAARAWADEVEQKQAALIELEQAKPKAEFYDAVTQSDDAIAMDEVAKVLNIKGFGRNNLFKFLRDKGVLQSGGLKHNQPYQQHCEAGRFRLVETSWQADNGDIRINMKTVALQKGLDYIRKLIEKHQA